MSYLVLARKYRPQTFEEIVGQEHVTRTLANAFAKGRVHHAFLFCGARGVGKTTAARVLAKALCCQKQDGPTATPCGACDACVTITSGTAVDYFEIDGASNNGVDDIRELRDGVRYQPAQLRRKIYVIDEVHMLSVAAFNALLKTLEEPPPHVTFVFATTEVHKIPVTILSRCQRYDFKLVPVGRLQAHLADVLGREKIAVEPGALSLLAREAGGSVRDALSLTDQVIAYVGAEALTEARVAEVLGIADRKLLRDLAGAVLGRDPRSALLAIDAAIDRGVDISSLARTFLGTLRDFAVVAEIKDVTGIVDGTAEEIAAIRELVKDVPRGHLVALFDRFARACEDMKESQTPRLLVDIALVDMAGSEPLQPIGELLDRLDQVEKRLRAGGGSGGGGAGGVRPTPVRAAPTASPTPSPSPTPTPSPSPSPTPSPAKALAYQAPENPMAEWERAIAKLDVTLATLYAQARLLNWSTRGIELGFTSGLTAERGADPDNVTKLKAFLAMFAGSPLDVKVKTIQADAAGPASVAEVENERRQSERDKRESEARQHPSTKAAMEVLGAVIKEIKVDG